MTVSTVATALIAQMQKDNAALDVTLAGGSAQDSSDVAAISAAYAPSSAKINASPPVVSALTVAPSTLPQPTAGQPYSEDMTVTGGEGAYTATLTGDAPSGASVSVSGATVTLSIPSPADTSPPTAYSFDVEIADSATPPNSETVAVDWSF